MNFTLKNVANGERCYAETVKPERFNMLEIGCKKRHKVSCLVVCARHVGAEKVSSFPLMAKINPDGGETAFF